MPEAWLIPEKVFASEYDLPPFRELSASLGLDVNGLAGGVIVEDFDQDGLYDVVVSAWDAHGPLRFFHNTGEGKFVERTSEAGLVGENGALNIQQTDYNNDGLPDIWMLRWKAPPLAIYESWSVALTEPDVTDVFARNDFAS